MKISNNIIINFGIMSLLAIPIAYILVYLIAFLASTKLTILVLLSILLVIPYLAANIMPVILPIAALMFLITGNRGRESSIGMILCIIAFVAKIFISHYWI